jgi:Family of unknown function (DUF6152)
MNANVVIRGVLAAVLAGMISPALAHHSVAMFDLEKSVTMEGTVSEFQYTNPHSWLHILVTGSDGKSVDWGFEAEGPSSLMRVGIKAKTFVAGDKITVVAHPMKDGRPAGMLLTVTGPDGRVYKVK